MSKLRLEFNDKPITVAEAFEGLGPQTGRKISPFQTRLWSAIRNGEPFSKAHPKGNWFSQRRLNPNLPCPTVTGTSPLFYSWEKPRELTKAEYIRVQSFPDDYKIPAKDISQQYICGMSVPPMMTKRIAEEVLKQWL